MSLPEPRNLSIRSYSGGVRGFALFVGFWMWMMPQMLNARALSTPDEYGSGPAPVNEEEETQHAKLIELVVVGHSPRESMDGQRWAPQTVQHPMQARHSDVPHPPPWKAD